MSRPSSAGSTKSTDSYSSVLSDDSYIASFKPGIDDSFKEMLNEIKMTDSNRSLLKERKIQSHEVKKRDPADTERRTNWTPQMVAEYDGYKEKVKLLEKAKAKQVASEKAAKGSKKSDMKTQEKLRLQALADDKAWLDAAIVAGTARLQFLKNHPNALSTPSTKTHIKAAEDNLNSARSAQREVEIQEKKIAKLKDIDQAKAAAAGKKKGSSSST
ncbi:hypothetical protein C7999DRAFT_31965 [Corynascus novoguineensis]|uniref:Uncharacterized protein n=1 Tax=Corynascus novoguineensis TaxID=1126955 RepID=A0AAN7CSS6_9PEZI|nr:hypothetical protein C7999DRAFT_31965 [Corynascus novoguineensis]